MRCLAAVLAVLLGSAAANAADKSTPIELSTNLGTKVKGTVTFATLKIKCDLGNMDVPLAKIDRISSASADSHWICLKSGDQIHATIQEPKGVEIATEFGRFKADWKQVSYLDIGANK